jgi:Flp pilus assembly pilin Flp
MSERFSLLIGRVLTTNLSDLVKRQEGQGVTEYGIVLAFVAVALAAVLVSLHTVISGFISDVGGLLDDLPGSF